jgi:Fur family iron response transcriptional regulator
MPETEALLDRMPEAPEGFEIARVDVVVRLRRKA